MPLLVGAQGPLVPDCGADCNFNHFILLINNVLSFLVVLAIVFSVIAFSYAGFLYVTSQGDQSKIKKAHGIFTKVIIGIITALLAYTLVTLLTSLLGLKTNIVPLCCLEFCGSARGCFGSLYAYFYRF